ncbi:MAG: hypothetical protein ACLFQJ_01295 [Campylobacterales bacterium]
MIDYTSSIMWLIAWPLIIYISYKFIRLNISHLQKLEKMDEERKTKDSEKA